MAGPFDMSSRMKELHEAERLRPKPKLNGTAMAPKIAPEPQNRPVLDDRPRQVPQQPKERLTALEQARKAKREVAAKYKHAKKHDFIQRHTKLMGRLRSQPWTVRILARTVNTATLAAAHMVHVYADGRSFAVSHMGGWCARGVQDARSRICSSCTGLFTRGNHSFCNGCNCGTTRVARLTWKRKLAWWLCPEGKFGPAPGWWTRPLRLLFGRRSKVEHDKLGRPMPQRGKSGRFERS